MMDLRTLIAEIYGDELARPTALAPPMASAELSRRVRKVVGYPPLCDMSDLQRREFHEALLDADSFEDLPGKWQAAILKAEENRPNLRIVGRDSSSPGRHRNACRLAGEVAPAGDSPPLASAYRGFPWLPRAT
jgi:hypothetical protein